MSAGGDPQELPGVLGLIAEEVGPGAALELARAFGGLEIYIPDHVPPDHRLALALGLENARRVAALLGRGDLTVPLGPASDGRHQKRNIERLLDAGETDKEIVRTLGCHIQTVRKTRRLLKAKRGGSGSGL